jgi:hypothetical protein
MISAESANETLCRHIARAKRTDTSSDTKSRIVLNESLAVEIYQYKLAFSAPSSPVSCFQSLERRIRGQSARVSSEFGVSPKTIRDVWNHKTWVHATNHLWSHIQNGPDQKSSLVSDAEYSVQPFGF